MRHGTYKGTMGLFSVGHPVLGMQPTLKILVCFYNESPFKETKFSFASW